MNNSSLFKFIESKKNDFPPLPDLFKFQQLLLDFFSEKIKTIEQEVNNGKLEAGKNLFSASQ
jgi:hypothetical protein